jgi:N-acetylmuramoyl-L-alanine amidase
MAELKILCIHCADTNPNFNLRAGHLEQWHKGPKDIKDRNGTVINVRYMGRTYPSRAALPLEYLDKRPIGELHGRGWDRLGYSDLLKRNGTLINLTEYDKDDWIDPDEMTWGATGINSIARHICLEGGRNTDNESGMFNFFDIFTDAQFTLLTGYINQFLKEHPGDKIAGHYMFANKTCPNFKLGKFFEMAGIDLKHIHS